MATLALVGLVLAAVVVVAFMVGCVSIAINRTCPLDWWIAINAVDAGFKVLGLILPAIAEAAGEVFSGLGK